MDIRCIAAVTVLALVVACAPNPVTRRRELTLMSESQEMAIGRDADLRVRQEMGLYNDPQLLRYISDIGQRMAKLSERPTLPLTC